MFKNVTVDLTIRNLGSKFRVKITWALLKVESFLRWIADAKKIRKITRKIGCVVAGFEDGWDSMTRNAGSPLKGENDPQLSARKKRHQSYSCKKTWTLLSTWVSSEAYSFLGPSDKSTVGQSLVKPQAEKSVELCSISNLQKLWDNKWILF